MCKHYVAVALLEKVPLPGMPVPKVLICKKRRRVIVEDEEEQDEIERIDRGIDNRRKRRA